MALTIAVNSECEAVQATLETMIEKMRRDGGLMATVLRHAAAADITVLYAPTHEMPCNAQGFTIVIGSCLQQINADIQVVLPVSYAQFKHTILRATLRYHQRAMAIGTSWVLDMRQKCLSDLTHGVANIELTDKELLLLHCLLKAKGNMLTREGLLREVWAYEETVDSHTLETHIYRLRHKCEAMGEAAPQIRAHEQGYSLVM